MKIQEFSTEKAEGVILMHDVHVEDRLLPRGYQLNKNDLLFLNAVGVHYISGIKLEPGDISADNALNSIVAKICGHNVAYTLPENGNCKIVAAGNGVLIASEERLAKLNRMCGQIILNTVAPYKNIKKGEVIGELTVSTPIIEKDRINEMVIRLSGNEPLLAISAKQQKEAAVIYTRMQNEDEENLHFTAIVRKLVKNLAELGINFTAEYNAPHTVEDIADTVQTALKFAQLVFIVPALPSSHKMDTLPSALNSLVDDIICSGIPHNGCNDLLIATKRSSKIIGIPFNYDTVNSPLADKYIKMAVTKETLNQSDFSRPETPVMLKGELSEAEKGRLMTDTGKVAREARIAAVILAAGTGSRARCNKLMVEVSGQPLFMKIVTAALKSKASPVFVVTGYQAEKIEKQLENIDVNILHNYEYATGVKTSIRLGLRSVPSYCDGAVLLPADMPNISAEYIDTMIDNFDIGQERQLLVTTDGIQKHNPVVWSRELYADADLVPENADMRQVFIEHSDYTKCIKTESDMCFDVNFPYDIEIITLQKSK